MKVYFFNINGFKYCNTYIYKSPDIPEKWLAENGYECTCRSPGQTAWFRKGEGNAFVSEYEVLEVLDERYLPSRSQKSPLAPRKPL
jgi:hypothetical protein